MTECKMKDLALAAQLAEVLETSRRRFQECKARPLEEICGETIFGQRSMLLPLLEQNIKNLEGVLRTLGVDPS